MYLATEEADAEWLEQRYDGKPIQRFLQLDGFAEPPSPIGTESHYFARITEDPQLSPTAVRIRIDPEATPDMVVAMLHELTDWYEEKHDGLLHPTVVMPGVRKGEAGEES